MDGHTEIRGRLDALQTLALTAWAEARSEFVIGTGWVDAPLQARVDVMSVVLNRYRLRPADFGETIKQVCFKRWAFSCWEPGGGKANYEAVMARATALIAGEPPSPKLRETLFLADALVNDRVLNSVPQCCHYYAASIPPPRWALGQTPVVTRHGHRFYAGIR